MDDPQLRSWAASLGPEVWEALLAEHKRKCEEAMMIGGVSITELKELFLERGNSSADADVMHESAAGFDTDALLETSAAEIEAGSIVEKRMFGMRTVEDGAKETGKVADGTSGEAMLSTRVDNRKVRKFRPSSWQLFEFDRDEIRELSQEQLASLWAAHIVRNDDTRQEEHEVLQNCLLSVLREQHLFADLIIDSKAVSSEELVQVCMDRTGGKGVEVTMGMKAMMGQFLCLVQRDH